MAVVIETTLGDITVDLYVKERPKTCLNFLKLCKMKYYNFNLFHLVQRGFIGQTGDPTGTGRGGESIHGILYGEQARYYEAEKIPRIKHNKRGTISMVNCGDQLLGSQWFITLAEDLDYLDGEHCAFGEIVEGLELLDKLNEVITDDDGRPFQDVRITHTVILDDPFDDPPGIGVHIPSRSPSPSKEMLDSGRIGADEDLDDAQGRTIEEIDEIIQEKEAKARATILEMVGDLPEADCAPPENVLFVCKLNPVTTDEDLEIIFSRFGKIVSCEVIRDQKSLESLQYAFIEFEDHKACEDAYFKMDNVLIDDRRIHVDFSQSVAKYKWKGKGRGVEVFKDKTEPGGGPGAKGTAVAPWVRGGAGTGRGGQDNRKRDGRNIAYPNRPHNQNPDQNRPRDQRDRERYSNTLTQRSRSPPRYSRRDAGEQSRKEKEPARERDRESSKKSVDDKLRELLKKELETKKTRKISKSNKKESSSSSSSSSDSDSSSSSSSSSSESDHKKSKKSKKRRKK